MIFKELYYLLDKQKTYSKFEAAHDILRMSEFGSKPIETSYRELANKWGWDKMKIIRFLQTLVPKFLAKITPTHKGCLIIVSETMNETLNETLKAPYTEGFREVSETVNETLNETQEKKKENEKKNPPHPLKEKKNKKEKNERDLLAHAHTHEGEILIDPEEYELSFENFWRLYDKKVGKPNCEKKWYALSKSDRRAAIEYIPLYIAAQPDKQFRKNPQTFLNQKSWNDEIINRTYKPTAAENIAAAQEQCIRDCADMLAGRRYETVQDNLPF